MEVGPGIEIHPAGKICPAAKIGPAVKIGPVVKIGPAVKIGLEEQSDPAAKKAYYCSLEIIRKAVQPKSH